MLYTLFSIQNNLANFSDLRRAFIHKTMNKLFLHQTLLFLILIIIFIIGIFSCSQKQTNNEPLASDPDSSNWCVEGVNEFRRGDIIVKPNVDFMPGTASVPNGWNFGHAVIVTKGFKHDNIDTLLSHITIVESNASDVAQPYQVREIAGLVRNKNLALNCTSFASKYAGNRFRLRLNLPKSQLDSIINFALDQKGDLSCWNATKSFPGNQTNVPPYAKNWADNTSWYCSLLVWQSVFYVTGIDLDVNGGFQVYPNDIITNPIFNNTENFTGRARF